MPVDAALASSLTPNTSLGDINLKSGDPTLTLSVGSGQTVILVNSLRTGFGNQVILNGPSDAVLVLRVSKRFRIGRNTKVLLTGGLTPDKVLWSIEGTGGRSVLRMDAEVPGTVVAVDRARLKLSAYAEVTGAVYGKQVYLNRVSIVHHTPFNALLIP